MSENKQGVPNPTTPGAPEPVPAELLPPVNSTEDLVQLLDAREAAIRKELRTSSNKEPLREELPLRTYQIRILNDILAGSNGDDLGTAWSEVNNISLTEQAKTTPDIFARNALASLDILLESKIKQKKEIPQSTTHENNETARILRVLGMEHPDGFTTADLRSLDQARIDEIMQEATSSSLSTDAKEEYNFIRNKRFALEFLIKNGGVQVIQTYRSMLLHILSDKQLMAMNIRALNPNWKVTIEI